MSRSAAQLGRQDWYAPDPKEPSSVERRLVGASGVAMLATRRLAARTVNRRSGFPATIAYPKVFVAGCGRSGTTWVQECLTGADAIVTTQESHAYEYIYEPLRTSGNTPTTWSHILNRYQMGRRRQRWTGLYWWVTRDQLLTIASTALSMRDRPAEDVAQQCIRAVFDSWYTACATPGNVLLEKTPGHIAFGAQILEGFPEAKIVEVVRDGRDVCVSLEKHAQTMQWPPTRREAQIRLWRRAVEFGETLQQHPLARGRVIRVYYEDLLADSRQELTRLFAALDVPVTESDVERIAATNDIGARKTKAGGQRRKGIAGDWRNEFSPEDTALFEELAGETARRIGYDDAGRGAPSERTAMIGRKNAGRVLRRLGLRQPPASWVTAERQPRSPQRVDFKLFGIIGAWMEEDVIGATVANALAQGCEQIYLVDNNSPDDTVAEAVRAGAVLAESFATESYDEQLRLSIMNRVVQEKSEQDGSEHIWWLWLDADEFPHGPGGKTVREYLTDLDRRFRIVGARFINHFPDRAPAYVPGFHPLDFQPLGEEHLLGCRLKHRKHPLQRFDRSGPPIICDRGFHRASSVERPLREPEQAIYLHHFPYRDPDVTRRRLAMLCATDESGRTRVIEGDDAADGMVPRFQTLDAVYRGDWDRVRNYRGNTDFSMAQPVPWTEIAAPQDWSSRRWYTDEDLAAAKRAAVRTVDS